MRSKNNKPQWTLLIAGIFASTVSADDMLASFDGGGFELPEFDEFSVPVVLTASRIQQHQADVPASVTILDADLIKQLGVKNLAEVFHYVPGMMVGADRNNNADTVHYHGGPAALPKNLQVLLNGRSMYRTGLASVSWYEMPVALEDISRIEVVRGPNAATYGANAYQAVINILTKHPSDTYGTSVSVTAGNNGEENIYLRHGASAGGADYRVSYSQKSTDHFKDYVDPEPGEECSEGERCSDFRKAGFVDLEVYKSLDGLGELEMSVTALQAEKGIANQVDNQSNENKASEDRYEVGLTFTKDISNKHQIQIRSYVSQYNQRQAIYVEDPELFSYLLNDDLRELFALNPQESSNIISATAAAIGGDDSFLVPTIAAMSSEEQVFANGFVDTYIQNGNLIANPFELVSGTVNADLDEYRFDVELQDTYVINSELTLVSGLSFRHDRVDSDHYFAGEKINDTSRLFSSITWMATQDLTAHFAFMAEKESSADFVFAPRAALNYKLTPSQSMRVVYSESVRSPDVFEQSANWNFEVEGAQSTNGTTYYQTQQGPENLDHQFIKSYEVGYYGRLQTMDSEIDIRVFKEDLTDVIYQSIKISDLRSIEGNNISFKGIEWQISTRPFDKTQFRMIGAHVEADWNISDEVLSTTLLRVYAQDSLTLSWLRSWPHSISSSVNYVSAHKYDQTNTNVGSRTTLERVELYVAKAAQFAGNELEVSMSMQHDLSSDPYIRNENIYEDDTRVQLGVRYNF